MKDNFVTVVAPMEDTPGFKAGILSGEILPVFRSIDPGIGREVRAYRPLGWCAHDGKVVPVGGAAPDVLIRGFSVRPV